VELFVKALLVAVFVLKASPGCRGVGEGRAGECLCCFLETPSRFQTVALADKGGAVGLVSEVVWLSASLGRL
jgi:hypothetical protein